MWSRQSKPSVDPADPHREWLLIESLLKEGYAEQRRARRWGIVFKSLTFLYLFGFALVFYLGARNSQLTIPNKPHVGLIRVEGVIAAEERANAARIGEGLRRAFENPQVTAVIVAINSPGGSPVQAGYIYDEIMRLRDLNPAKKIYAVIADIGASGGYYIAAAADEIYADKASLVGSIGVISSGFGFTGLMDKLGIERRLFTAGEQKAFLDPFSNINEEDAQFWQTVLANTHQQFIDAVKRGRGAKLEMSEEITSGLVWNGEQALSLGLVDGLGSVRFVARERVGETTITDYTPMRSPLHDLLQELAVSVGAGLGGALLTETRSLPGQY